MVGGGGVTGVHHDGAGGLGLCSLRDPAGSTQQPVLHFSLLCYGCSLHGTLLRAAVLTSQISKCADFATIAFTGLQGKTLLPSLDPLPCTPAFADPINL